MPEGDHDPVDAGVRRRDFLRAVAAAGIAAAVPWKGALVALGKEPSPADAPEALLQTLFKSLTPEQRKIVALPWDDPRRLKVANNWKIVEPRIDKVFTPDQKTVLRDLFRGLVSGDGYERFQKQMKDDYGGFEQYHVAFFGDPASGPCQGVFTGRHLTIRAGGDPSGRMAFGGPIFYGHAVEFDEKPDHPGNVWWHQSRLANRIYAAMDGTQRKKALVEASPPDEPGSVALPGEKGPFDGLAASELSKDQKALLEETIRELLAPYRASDVETAMKGIRQGAGIDGLHIAYYREENLGDDEIWDRWRIQGPAMSWYFRGSPHVHTWVAVGAAS